MPSYEAESTRIVGWKPRGKRRVTARGAVGGRREEGVLLRLC
jgi:hypothetical protein